MTLSILENGRVVEVNRSFTELTGFTREELVGKTSVELGIVTEGDWEKLREALKENWRFRSIQITVGAKWGPRPALVSGEVVELSGGSTDLGNDLREILVTDARGRTHELEWEELEVA